MKISELGRFVLISENLKQYTLEYGTNLICIKENKIFTGGDAIIHRNNADTIFIISFTEELIVLIKSSGKLSVNNCEVEVKGSNLADNDIIGTEKTNIQFKFLYDDLALEKIIDLFMEGNLYYSLDMNHIFYEYAKKINITDKKAISNVMAAIDIPEIDEL